MTEATLLRQQKAFIKAPDDEASFQYERTKS